MDDWYWNPANPISPLSPLNPIYDDSPAAPVTRDPLSPWVAFPLLFLMAVFFIGFTIAIFSSPDGKSK